VSVLEGEQMRKWCLWQKCWYRWIDNVDAVLCW